MACEENSLPFDTCLVTYLNVLVNHKNCGRVASVRPIVKSYIKKKNPKFKRTSDFPWIQNEMCFTKQLFCEVQRVGRGYCLFYYPDLHCKSRVVNDIIPFGRLMIDKIVSTITCLYPVWLLSENGNNWCHFLNICEAYPSPEENKRVVFLQIKIKEENYLGDRC